MGRIRTPTGWAGLPGSNFPIFTSNTDRDTNWPNPPNGSFCVTTDTGSVWQRFPNLWYRPNARLWRQTSSADNNGVGTGGLTMGFSPSVTIPPNRLIGIYGHYNFTVLANGAYMYARYNTGAIAIQGRMAQFNGASGLAGFSLEGIAMFGSGGGITTVFDVVVAAVSGTVNVVNSQDLGWWEAWDMGAQ